VLSNITVPGCCCASMCLTAHCCKRSLIAQDRRHDRIYWHGRPGTVQTHDTPLGSVCSVLYVIKGISKHHTKALPQSIQHLNIRCSSCNCGQLLKAVIYLLNKPAHPQGEVPIRSPCLLSKLCCKLLHDYYAVHAVQAQSAAFELLAAAHQLLRLLSGRP